jgi:hypothetical protein
MKQQKLILLVVTLGLIASSAGVLANMRAHQKLGPPAVKAESVADSIRLEVLLPERVLDYESKAVPEEQMVLDYLPKDTSFGQRLYTAPDGAWARVNVVLMGTDRTSLHKPQFCLEGQGWSINDNLSSETSVHIERPHSYDLPVMKIIGSKVLNINGQQVQAKGVYVYWFVAQNEITAKHWQRMWWMARDLFSTGVLQRWAYISYFSACKPGQEDVTFERMKKLISASVPEFQLTPTASVAPTASAKP